MVREDRGRFQNGKPLINKDELLKMARSQEDYLLALEAEMRAAGQVSEKRLIDDIITAGAPIQFRASPAERKLFPQLQEQLGPASTNYMPAYNPDKATIRACHNCGIVGHIARNCTKPKSTSPSIPAVKKKLDFISEHKTEGHTCESCGKLGHT